MWEEAERAGGTVSEIVIGIVVVNESEVMIGFGSMVDA